MDPNKIIYINGLVEECRALGLRDGAHNAFLQEFRTKALKTVADVARETEAFRRRGTMTAEIGVQMAVAEEKAVGELEAFAAEVRALSPRERSIYSMPKREVIHPGVAAHQEAMRVQAEIDAAGDALNEIEAAGGYAVLVAPTTEGGRETVQVVGCKLDALSEATRTALRAYGHWCAREVRQRQGIVN
jgi:hypothetical protein